MLGLARESRLQDELIALYSIQFGETGPSTRERYQGATVKNGED